jgi:hypothetical protein
LQQVLSLCYLLTMKIALTLLALLGIANAQRIPLVEEVIRQGSEEIIYDDAPMREHRTLKHVDESVRSPLVEEVIRRGSEEIIYSDITSKGFVQQADVSRNGKVYGMHSRALAPDLLRPGHEKASHSGVPQNETERSTHFKDPSRQKRDRRHRTLLDLSITRNPNEEVRMIMGYVDGAGKSLIENKAGVVHDYIDEVNVVSATLMWGQVKDLLNDPGIE